MRMTVATTMTYCDYYCDCDYCHDDIHQSILPSLGNYVRAVVRDNFDTPQSVLH